MVTWAEVSTPKGEKLGSKEPCLSLKFEDAFGKLQTYVGSPCLLEIADEELWGLKGGVLQAIIFRWAQVKQEDRESFLKRIFGERVTRPYLVREDNELELANKDLVPFALLGRQGLYAEGATLEARIDPDLVGVLFFDLAHGSLARTCPILLWDLTRFGKVAGETAALKLRLGELGEVSHVVQSMPLRTFVRAVDGQLHYWEIEVTGRRVKMQRGLLKSQGQKDWATNQAKEADFPSSSDAKTQADSLVRRYLGEGYAEQPTFRHA